MKKKMHNIYIGLLVIFSATSCMDLQTGEDFDGVASGDWKGVFVIDDKDVPVLFKIENTNVKEQKAQIIFKDGTVEMKADSVRIWGDSLFVMFEKANKELKLKFEVDQMEGFLYDNDNKHYPIKFIGQFGLINRFPDVRQKPTANLTGSWRISANTAKDSIVVGRLRIAADGNHAEGKLLLETGVDISLEGTIQDNKIYLSGFNGHTICLLSAEIGSNQILINGNMNINEAKYFWTARAIAGIEQQQ